MNKNLIIAIVVIIALVALFLFLRSRAKKAAESGAKALEIEKKSISAEVGSKANTDFLGKDVFAKIDTPYFNADLTESAGKVLKDTYLGAYVKTYTASDGKIYIMFKDPKYTPFYLVNYNNAYVK